MRRRLARPFGQTMAPSRLLSLLMALAVLWVLYDRFKQPATWAWMTNDKSDGTLTAAAQETPTPSVPAAVPGSEKATSPEKPVPKEIIVPGPNETDADELLKLRKSFKVVTDKRPLEPHEMPAYWQLMAWSRTRPLAEFEKTAQRDVAYSQLWEQPDLYRGHAIRLRLHVRRVLKYEAPKNDLGLKDIYEVWGWTDDSRSYPYVVVIPERPAGLKVGTDIEGEIVFVGYFLKWMSYRAFDKGKNSPLLVGRARPATGASPAKKADSGWETAFLVLAAVALGIGGLAWLGLSSWRKPQFARTASVELPDTLPEPTANANTGTDVTIPPFPTTFDRSPTD